MKDTIARIVRTLVQGGMGGIVASVVDLFLIELSDAQVASLTVLLTLVATVVMNALEDSNTIPALMYPEGK